MQAHDRLNDGGPVVIDLGVLAPLDDADILEPEPGRRGPRGARPRPSPWTVVLLVLAFCTIGATSATEPPPPARLVLSASGVIDTPLVVGDSLLASIDGEITSFDLTSGAVKWSYDPPRRMQTLAGHGTAVMAPVSCSSRSVFQTLGLDADSGEQRWNMRGAPVWLVDGAPIVVIKQPVRGCSEATLGFDPLPSAPFTWLGVDLLTGAVRWRLKVPASVGLAAGVGPDGYAHWLAVYEAGLVTTFDLRTGTAIGRYKPPVPDPSAPLQRIVGAGDQLLVARRDRNNVMITALDAPGLRPRWDTTISMPASSRLDLAGFLASSCGPVVCFGPSNLTVGLDPVSGREKWRLVGRPARIGAGYGLFLRPPQPVKGPALAVHDLASGVERVALRDTELLNREWGDPLLNRVAPGGRLWRLDLTDGRLHAVTVLPGSFADCDAGGRYLACRSSKGELRVWRLPVAAVPRSGVVA